MEYDKQNSLEPRDDAKYVQSLNEAVAYLSVLIEDMPLGEYEAIEALIVDCAKEDGGRQHWEKIRTVLRRYDVGTLSDRFEETFRYFARLRFANAWNKLECERKRDVFRNWNYHELLNRPLERADVIRNDASYWFERDLRDRYGVDLIDELGPLVDVAVDEFDVAFLASEFLLALDDYEADPERDEARRLSAETVDALAKKAGLTRVDLRKQESVKEKLEEPSSSSEAKSNVSSDKKPYGYYSVDERAAADAQRAYSFNEYVPNSATNSYRADVDRAREIARKHKREVDALYHEKIDRALDQYERRLASWYDRRNLAEASCPSVMISGAGNFPRAKHEQKIARLDALYKELDELRDFLDKLRGIGTAGISSDDENAVDKLETKLEQLRATHEDMKRANVHLRKYATWEGFEPKELVEDAYDAKGEPAGFYLTNSLATIRRIEQRIETLKRQKLTDYGDGWKFEGGVARIDKEANRIQICFDDVPSAEVRARLKQHGFRWAPSVPAWQRMINDDSIYAAKLLGYIPKDWRPKGRRLRQDDDDNE